MTEGNGEARELPKGWALTTVGEAIKIIDYRGRTPPYSEDGIPHLRSSNIRNRKIVWEDLRYVSEETYQAYMTRGLPEKDDVLFTTEAPLGEVALAPDQRFSLAQRMMILRPNKDLLSSKFLLYQIEDENFQKKLKNSGTGTTVTGVSSRNFQPISILLAPVYEQERIVEKIEELFSELDQGIENLKTAQKQLKVYRQAVLKWAFEGKLTEQWRQQAQQQGTLKTGEELLAQIKAERENRYQQQVAAWEATVKIWEANGKPGKKPSKPKKFRELPSFSEVEVSELPSLPKAWQWVKLGNISTNIQIGPFGSLLHKADYVSNQIPAINPSHIKDLKIHPDSEQTVTQEKFDQLANYALMKGDIIMGRRGEMGRCAVVTHKEDRYLCGTGSLFIRLTDSLNRFFYCFILSSQRVKSYLENTCIGTTMQNLNEDILHNVPVPLCSPIEQEKILEEIELRLSNCDALEQTIADNLQKAEALRQSILKQAFEGKLVPQDPNDEPAEKLLERIRVEKQSRGNTGKGNQSKPQQLTLPEV